MSSGHRVSVSKTQIFFSNNCSLERKQSIANHFGLEIVDDLGKYLGVSLLYKRVTRATYQYLIEKIDQRLSGWKAKSLALAGRITLAKAVLQAIPIYTMQTTWLPKGICDEIEKRIRRFVWGITPDHNAINLVKWDTVKKPSNMGGLNFCDVQNQNYAFLMKVGYHLVCSKDKLWVQVLRDKYKWIGELPSEIYRRNSSRFWQGVSHFWEAIKQSMCWQVCNGWKVDFWWDV